MKTLLKIFIGAILLIFILPLAWFLIKEAIFFLGMLFEGAAFVGLDFGSILTTIIFIVGIVLLLKYIFS